MILIRRHLNYLMKYLFHFGNNYLKNNFLGLLYARDIAKNNSYSKYCLNYISL